MHAPLRYSGPATNKYTRIGRILLGIAAFIFLVIAIVPIITTAIGVQSKVQHDPSSYGPGGMVVFATVILAPVWAFLATGWFAIPGLIYMIRGYIEAKRKLLIVEYMSLGLAIVWVFLAIISAPKLVEAIKYLSGN